jgi:phosphoribosylaminoimidazolecarboxamide formyltransferase / IMP cyclohydrolase
MFDRIIAEMVISGNSGALRGICWQIGESQVDCPCVPEQKAKRRALLSVSDKTGLEAFARMLSACGWEILSTGGTQKILEQAGIAVTAVESITGFPECFGGRVKTMHPKIMGGILFRRDNTDDKREVKERGIAPIDLVCVNLYPFEELVGKSSDRSSLIENVDIGGPTLLRSAAKNATHVTVICDPKDYDHVAAEIEQHGDTTLSLREELAAKVFARTAAYDALIAETLSGGMHRGTIFTNGVRLRYGENPHQWGMYYDRWGVGRSWQVIQEEKGKTMSYLNLLDADGAWNLVREFSEPTAACIKHANPSGAASNHNISDAFQRAYDSDKLSAFGVIVALNQPCTGAIIRKIIDQKIFVEVIIAPGFDREAANTLKEKPKIRAIEIRIPHSELEITHRTALGGMLMQNKDGSIVTEENLTCVTERKPTQQQITDMLFAWKVVKHATSNAIVFAKDRATVGIGCGQTSRVDATWIAAKRAGDNSRGAVMASDAFFPFPDSVEEAAKNGIAAIIQPGGSVRDNDVRAKAEELGIAMVFTGVRAFRH